MFTIFFLPFNDYNFKKRSNMQNNCCFTMQEQLNQVLNILQKDNIENYPDVIIMLCKKLSILYMDD